jgi:hypothetical protein
MFVVYFFLIFLVIQYNVTSDDISDEVILSTISCIFDLPIICKLNILINRTTALSMCLILVPQDFVSSSLIGHKKTILFLINGRLR